MGVKERIDAAWEESVGQYVGGTGQSCERDGLLCASPYRTPMGVGMNAGIACAVNGSFGAGMVVGR
jgi:hypothetical protein